MGESEMFIVIPSKYFVSNCKRHWYERKSYSNLNSNIASSNKTQNIYAIIDTESQLVL